MIETCAGITASALISAAGTTLTETVRAAFSAKAPDSFRISEKTLASWQPQAKRPAPLSRAEILLEAISTQLTSAMSQRKEPHDLPQRIYLATTVGTIDLLEQDLDAPDCVEYLRQAVIRRWNCTDVRVVSAACASGQLAATLATRAVLNGEVSAALALGLDIDSEFVTSGFKALGAVTPERIRPYDSQRQGMLLGEGAAGLLIANVHNCHCPQLIGWGESCDAAHITAPDLKGKNLAQAICSALELAGLSPADIGGVIGHGTGTHYNDQAEIAALHRVFGTRPLPLFSLKGITGHTIGAAGAMQ